MSTTIDWTDIAVRLGLTLLAGVLIGANRWELGKAAGLRTTTLVGLAACVAMIQVNLLLPMAGRSSNSFVMNDLMRLPLGVLTGVGFIGGGAILRRGDMVVGVTTAATLWLITIIGLCLGGGQLGLGTAATLLGLLALWGLRAIESAIPSVRSASILVEVDAGTPTEHEIFKTLRDAGFHIVAARMRRERSGRLELRFDLRTLEHHLANESPPLVGALASTPGVATVAWHWSP
jgi:putative Mg2+ transporter-C (MgtC) family protein